MKRRARSVETVFANLKHNLGFRRFSLRGLGQLNRSLMINDLKLEARAGIEPAIEVLQFNLRISRIANYQRLRDLGFQKFVKITRFDAANRSKNRSKGGLR